MGDDTKGLVGIAIIAALLFSFGVIIGVSFTHVAAAEAGAGEYYIDDNHKSRFRYIVPEKPGADTEQGGK